MNALLIYPTFPDTYWGFRHALSFQGKRAAQAPLGLMTVAALLPTSWRKRLVDCNVEPLKERDLAWADVALVSGMHIQREQLISMWSVAAHEACEQSWEGRSPAACPQRY